MNYFLTNLMFSDVIVSIAKVVQIDLVGVRVFLKKYGMLIITMYIPPGLPISCYEQMFEYLENTVDFSEPILIIGDFNIPELIECEIGTRTTQMFNIYSHFLSLNDLKQRNKVCNSFSKLLDLVLSTDSLALEGEPDVMFQRQTDFTKFNFYKADLEGLYLALSIADWSKLLNCVDVDDACNNLYNTIYGLFEQYVPLAKYKTSKYPLWFTKHIIQLIKQKSRHWNKYRKTKAQYHYDRVKSLSTEIRREVKKEYAMFIRNTENSIKNDPKRFWSFFNAKRKSTSIPGRMTHDGNELTTSADIVQAFADQFASVFSNNGANHQCDSNCEMNGTFCEFCDKSCCASKDFCNSCDSHPILSKFVIDRCDILNSVKKLKSNFVTGPDNIPAFLVVDCINSLIEPLLDIIPEQHGFVKGRSTMTNLCEFTQYVSNALDRRLQVDTIYTDLSKAFDTSVIVGRQQYVEFGGHKSSIFNVGSGVAQGSNLGPLLFILFFNDATALGTLSSRGLLGSLPKKTILNWEFADLLYTAVISIKPSMQTALKSLLCTAALLKHESESNTSTTQTYNKTCCLL
ncbi:uncharacterized protein LOC135143785 [Zophobas morio]|uniref:uncharacterized protein LOC135143785 n=1 Tax=Zophobas morio TaxID=2755281 RepID=UPI003082E7F4